MSYSSPEQAILVLLRGVLKNTLEESYNCSSLDEADTTDQSNSCIYEICEAVASVDNSITCGTGDYLGNLIGYFVDEYTS